MTTALPILVRAIDWNDPMEVNLVRSSWLRSNASSGLARSLGRKAYYSGHHDLIDRLMRRGEMRIACSVTRHDTIVGWACVEPATVHYVFVREEFRCNGVARRLLAELPDRVTYTHRTDMCRSLPIPALWFYNAYAAFLPKEAA